MNACEQSTKNKSNNLAKFCKRSHEVAASTLFGKRRMATETFSMNSILFFKNGKLSGKSFVRFLMSFEKYSSTSFMAYLISSRIRDCCTRYSVSSIDFISSFSIVGDNGILHRSCSRSHLERSDQSPTVALFIKR